MKDGVCVKAVVSKMVCERWCLTKWCVKDCERWCVKKLCEIWCVTKWCVKDGV